MSEMTAEENFRVYEKVLDEAFDQSREEFEKLGFSVEDRSVRVSPEYMGSRMHWSMELFKSWEYDVGCQSLFIRISKAEEFIDMPKAWNPEFPFEVCFFSGKTKNKRDKVFSFMKRVSYPIRSEYIPDLYNQLEDDIAWAYQELGCEIDE